MLTYDTSLKVGDIITSYHKGYWRITKISRRYYTGDDAKFYKSLKDFKIGDEYNPVIHYVKVMDTNFKPSKGKSEFSSDGGYCKKVDITDVEKERDKTLKDIADGYARLILFLKSERKENE